MYPWPETSPTIWINLEGEWYYEVRFYNDNPQVSDVGWRRWFIEQGWRVRHGSREDLSRLSPTRTLENVSDDQLEIWYEFFESVFKDFLVARRGSWSVIVATWDPLDVMELMREDDSALGEEDVLEEWLRLIHPESPAGVQYTLMRFFRIDGLLRPSSSVIALTHDLIQYPGSEVIELYARENNDFLSRYAVEARYYTPDHISQVLSWYVDVLQDNNWQIMPIFSSSFGQKMAEKMGIPGLTEQDDGIEVFAAMRGNEVRLVSLSYDSERHLTEISCITGDFPFGSLLKQ